MSGPLFKFVRRIVYPDLEVRCSTHAATRVNPPKWAQCVRGWVGAANETKPVDILMVFVPDGERVLNEETMSFHKDAHVDVVMDLFVRNANDKALDAN